MPIGIPEIIIVLVVSFLAVVPVGACVWAVLALVKLRSAQEQMLRRLDGIERALQRDPGV